MELGVAHSPLGVPANQVRVSEARGDYDYREKRKSLVWASRGPPGLHIWPLTHQSLLIHSFIHSSPDLANVWVFLRQAIYVCGFELTFYVSVCVCVCMSVHAYACTDREVWGTGT